MPMTYLLQYPLPNQFREKERVPSVLDLIHYSKKARNTLDKLKEFLKEHVYPVEMVRN